MSAKERPILMSGAMVRACLAGTKTQTRRVIKPQPYIDRGGNFCWAGRCYGQSLEGLPLSEKLVNWKHPKGRVGYCPYGQPGDRLWVRERHQMASCDDGPVVLYHADNGRWHPPYEGEDFGSGPSFDYDQFPSKKWALGYWAADVEENDGPWVPSIHMPRWACRVVLEIVSVRVERLQDISEADALAEGIQPYTDDGVTTYKNYLTDEMGGLSAVESYKTLWESINGPGSWAQNPWVWVVEFKRVLPA